MSLLRALEMRRIVNKSRTANNKALVLRGWQGEITRGSLPWIK
ncbi:hypothetical protein [Thalassolituus pacificus]|jgi:hypothetical protein|uniref:Uncharacterized protein n=1 Tax=Thalassolituus pacificus TaxID=2975440 RepID=A0A9X3AG67_9GAMM|nr:hypothetical protein [Thalassolituus pacificus]MCT7359057.1 hypothetical protein [Thalassolituus pacificus]